MKVDLCIHTCTKLLMDPISFMQGWLFSYDPFWRPPQMKVIFIIFGLPTVLLVFTTSLRISKICPRSGYVCKPFVLPQFIFAVVCKDFNYIKFHQYLRFFQLKHNCCFESPLCMENVTSNPLNAFVFHFSSNAACVTK